MQTTTTKIQYCPNENLIKVETNPKNCNNGNITLRFLAFADSTDFVKTNAVGEQDEVENVSWFELKVAKNLNGAGVFGIELFYLRSCLIKSSLTSSLPFNSNVL